MIEEPDLVIQVHQDFMDAGARVITLNNYIATPLRLADQHKTEWFLPLHEAALRAAHRSRSQMRTAHTINIAGCLPPLVSSYHSGDVPPEHICLEQYRRLVAVQTAGVDLFLCETLSCVMEVQTATAAAVESGKPTWVAMTVDDHNGTRLRSGEYLADGVFAAKAAGAQGVLINCAWPEAATQGMPILAESQLPFGAYANGFTRANALQRGKSVDGLQARADLDPLSYASHAMRWVEMGASIVGGCCEVGPAHIRALASTLGHRGFTLTDRLPA